MKVKKLENKVPVKKRFTKVTLKEQKLSKETLILFQSIRIRS